MLRKKVEDWVDYIKKFATIMPNNPQAAFAGYAWSLQFKWAYIQRTIKVEERVYELVEDVINCTLLPSLFDARATPNNLCNLTSIPA
eukprot:13972651-Ditylum_brightwellii.AAC.1